MKCHEASITFHQEIWPLPRFHVISTKKGHRKNLFSTTYMLPGPILDIYWVQLSHPV